MKTGHVLILGCSLIIAALVFGLFFYHSRAVENSVGIVGAATKRFDSDIVKWRIALSRNTGLSDLNHGFAMLQSDLKALTAILAEKGIKPEEITIQPINTYPEMGRDGQKTGYNLQQSAFVITSQLKIIEDLALNPAALVEKGLIMQNSNLEYFYSKMSDIKMELLAEATNDARRRAEEMVKNSGVTLGNITSLKAGVFQINEPYSNEVSDYGMYNTQTKQKDITVTVRATFAIR